jgi:hypothetical protein
VSQNNQVPENSAVLFLIQPVSPAFSVFFPLPVLSPVFCLPSPFCFGLCLYPMLMVFKAGIACLKHSNLFKVKSVLTVPFLLLQSESCSGVHTVKCSPRNSELLLGFVASLVTGSQSFSPSVATGVKRGRWASGCVPDVGFQLRAF